MTNKENQNFIIKTRDKEKQKQTKNLIIKLSKPVIGILLIIINQNGKYDTFLACCLLFFNIMTLMKARKNWYLLLILLCITYCNYSICAANYFPPPIKSFFTGYAETAIGSSGLNILMLFSVALYLITPLTNSPQKKDEKKPLLRALIINNKYNPIIVIGIDVILALIWIYGYSRPDAVGERGATSPLYEYSIIFVIIGLFYSGRKKYFITSTVVIGLLFAFQNFIYGGRVTGVQMLILITFAIYIDKLKLIIVLPLATIGFILMSAIGQLRGAIFVSRFEVNDIINQLLYEKKFALDTAYSAYYTSMTFLDVLQETSVLKRLYLFYRWVLSIFLGGSVSDSNLAIYTRQTHIHYFGGVLPYYGWFYLGIPGVILLSYYLHYQFKAIKHVDATSSGLSRCLSLYVTCTCLRWYLYSPSQLFRGAMFFCIIYGFCYSIDCVVKKKPINIRNNVISVSERKIKAKNLLKQ